jgi:cytochrome c biogenesis protein ResB
LDKATAEYYPNTAKPKRFESKVTRIENGSTAMVEIKMNEPMRYEGLTFYQRMMGRENAQNAASRPYSQLEVVSNPADQWPKYSLYVVAFGLLVHFVMKFVGYIKRTL